MCLPEGNPDVGLFGKWSQKLPGEEEKHWEKEGKKPVQVS